jgi:hypothetical protein
MPQNLVPPPATDKPKLLDQVRDVIRRKHFSLRTERIYCDWIRRFILYHRKRHPQEMGETEITEFLTHLARDGLVAASTQNQALISILFLYREVLNQHIGWLDRVERAKRPARLPAVLTRDEARRVNWGRFERNTKRMSNAVSAKCFCRTPSPGSFRMLRGNGAGNMSFRRRVSRLILGPDKSGAIIPTRVCCKQLLRKPFGPPGLRKRRRVTPCGTRSRRIYSKMATISGPYRNFSGTRM